MRPTEENFYHSDFVGILFIFRKLHCSHNIYSSCFTVKKDRKRKRLKIAPIFLSDWSMKSSVKNPNDIKHSFHKLITQKANIIELLVSSSYAKRSTLFDNFIVHSGMIFSNPLRSIEMGTLLMSDKRGKWCFHQNESLGLKYLIIVQPHRSHYPMMRFSVNLRRLTALSTAVTWPKAPRKRPYRKPSLRTVKFKKFASSKTRDTHSSGKYAMSSRITILVVIRNWMTHLCSVYPSNSFAFIEKHVPDLGWLKVAFNGCIFFKSPTEFYFPLKSWKLLKVGHDWEAFSGTFLFLSINLSKVIFLKGKCARLRSSIFLLCCRLLGSK